MNRKDLYQGFGEVDDDILERSESARQRKKKTVWLKWGALAACLAAAVIAGMRLIPGKTSIRTSVGGVAREYKGAFVSASEIAVEWPWEYRTVPERFSTVIYAGTEYIIKTTVLTVDPSSLGERIGTCEGIGCDTYTEQEYRQNFDVRAIAGISEKLMIAVEMEGKFYVFQYGEYDPPAALGDVLDGYRLSETLTLKQFGVWEGGSERGYYSLPDDAPIWQVLTECRSAPFVEDDVWSNADKDYISFTATSEALGVYKRVFCVSSDGYASTNLFDWGYTFYIGEDAAKEIISYAERNAAEADREPYLYSLAGTLTGIGDGYLLVDDSILCADPADGMVFKVLTSDLRIRRCLDCQNIGTGDLVVVTFMGEVDTDAGNIISGAISMTTGTICEGEVQIPE